MEENIDVEHFYAYNDIAVFPASYLKEFRKFRELIMQMFGELPDDNFTIAVSVSTFGLLTRSSFDNGTFRGYLFFNVPDSEIWYVQASTDKIQTKLMDVIVNVYGPDIKIVFVKKPSDVLATYFVKYGFVDPVYNQKTKKIVMTYLQRIPTKQTLAQLYKVASSIEKSFLTLTVFVPTNAAEYISKCVTNLTEVAGHISITKYTEDGVAILGINTENVNFGTEHNVGLALTGKFSFHTHPDLSINELQLYNAWPSSTDIVSIVNAVPSFTTQLAHFVGTPTGLWMFYVSVPFQKLLIELRTNFATDCANILLSSIENKFLEWENKRHYLYTDPLNRPAFIKEFIEFSSTYTVKQLLEETKQLNETCQLADYHLDAPLLVMKYVEWSKFQNSNEGVLFTLNYVQDDGAGATSFIPPYN